MDHVMEESGLGDYLNDRYESGSTKWLLEEEDLTVEYDNDDNSITTSENLHDANIQRV